MPTYTFRKEVEVAGTEAVRDAAEAAATIGQRFISEGDKFFVEWVDTCTISEMEELESQGIIVVPSAPYLGDPVRQGLKKPSDGFRDVLRTIKKRHKGGSRIDATRGINTF